MEQNNQEKQVKTKKSNPVLFLVAILLIAIIMISSSIGLYAWAKYTSSQSGNATAVIAKWSFDLKLKNGSAAETTETINLADTIDYTHVQTGRIAPGTSGEFQVIVNTTGTEVDCQYDVTIVLSNCPRNITFSRTDDSNPAVTTELSAGGADNSTTRILTFSRYLKAKGTNGNENGRHVETIAWDWPYEADVNETAANKTAWDTRDNQDNGLQTTMRITAKGTEMLQAPAPAATVQSLAQSGQIQQWDSVNYNPGTATTASINLPEGAAIEGAKLAAVALPSGATLSGTISADSATDWVVLDVNQTTGEVLIMPRTYSQTNLSLSGMDGYNNAIQALDTVAGIYKNDLYATSSRSLTVDDVNKVENYTPNGSVAQYSWNHKISLDSNLNIVNNDSVAVRTYKSTADTGYYSYSTNYFHNMKCWLASRCIFLDQNAFYVNVRYLENNNVNSGNLSGLYYISALSLGSNYSKSNPVVPVVTLKLGIQMTKDENDVWQLSIDQ